MASEHSFYQQMAPYALQAAILCLASIPYKYQFNLK